MENATQALHRFVVNVERVVYLWLYKVVGVCVFMGVCVRLSFICIS